MADAKKIIDIVEGCICHIPDSCFMLCPHVDDDATEDCMENLLRDALEVMKSQQAEIERLKAQPTIIETDSFKYVFPKKDGDRDG